MAACALRVRGGPLSTPPAIVALVLNPYTAGAAALFYGASPLVAAWRALPGCEATTFSNLVLVARPDRLSTVFCAIGRDSQPSDDRIPAQSSGEPGPDSPTELQSSDWKATRKRTLEEIKEDRVMMTARGERRGSPPLRV